MATRKPTPPTILDDLMSMPGVSRETDTAAGAVVRVPLDRILDNPYQYRTHYDPTTLAELATNIHEMRGQLPATSGLQSPPLARMVIVDEEGNAVDAIKQPGIQLLADPNVRVQLLMGHRRLRAFRLLAAGSAGFVADDEFATLPVLLVAATDGAMWRHALTENTQRDGVSAIEEAQLLRRAVDEFGLSLEEAGAPFGWSRSAVSNKLRLLDLPEAYRAAVVDGTISETHGRTLLTLKAAPQLLETLKIAGIATLSRAQLERNVKLLIAQCKPLPPTANVGYTTPRWDGTNEVFDRSYNPPPWPYDWMPDADQCDPAIVGPCDRCIHRIQFAGDPGPRCVNRQIRGGKMCHEAKDQQWHAIQIERQNAVAASLMRLKQDPPPVATAAATVERKPLAEYSDEDWDAVREEAKVADAYKAALTALDAPVATVEQLHDVQFFGSYPASKDLIDKGICAPDRCECFVVAYNKHADGNCVRPDAKGAPNMCYGCTSKARLSHRKLELEHGDVGAKRKEIKATNEACHRRLVQALAHFSAYDIWNNAAFLRAMIKAGGFGWSYQAADAKDAATLQEDIWLHVAGSSCRSYGGMTVAGEERHWDATKVEYWLKAIADGAGIPMPPAAGGLVDVFMAEMAEEEVAA